MIVENTFFGEAFLEEKTCSHRNSLHQLLRYSPFVVLDVVALVLVVVLLVLIHPWPGTNSFTLAAFSSESIDPDRSDFSCCGGGADADCKDD
jgi:hypothetical protein